VPARGELALRVGTRPAAGNGVQQAAGRVPRRRPLAMPVTGVVGRSPDLLEPIRDIARHTFLVIMNALAR
jgi:hypothetical protein